MTITLPRRFLNVALVSTETEREYGRVVDENYLSSAVSNSEPCLGLWFTYASDAVRFSTQLTLALVSDLGLDEGGALAFALADLSALVKDGSWWVLFFPGVVVSDEV